MRPKITIWTQIGCARCGIVSDWFCANDYEVETRSAEPANLAAEPEDVRNTVMADLQMQDGTFPLVYIGRKVVHPDDVESIIQKQQRDAACI